MKSVFTAAFSLLIFTMSCFCYAGTQSRGSDKTQAENCIIQINCTDDLNHFINQCITGYNSINPDVHFTVTSDPVKSDDFKGISFRSSENGPSDNYQFKVVVGHSAVVPVFNSSNPLLKLISEKGISSPDVLKILTERTYWSQIFNGGPDNPVQIIAENNQVITCLAKYCRTDPSLFKQISIMSAGELIRAIRNNVNAIGFCKLPDLLSAETGQLPENLSFMPVDKNSNNRIDAFEMIYDNTEELSRGIQIGKYPSALCTDIFAAMQVKPTDKNTIAFLDWLITGGNHTAAASGFTSLVQLEKESSLYNLTGLKVTGTNNEPTRSTGIWLFLISIVILIGIITVLIFGFSGKKESVSSSNPVTPVRAFSWNSIRIPKGLYFDKSHTWSFLEKDGKVRIGIDDFLQHVTGSITNVRLKQNGEFIRRGEKILTLVRNGKQLNIHSPISGTIAGKNVSLGEDSSFLNKSPFDEGWIYLVEPVNWEREIQFMLMSEKYRDWIKEEFSRLKDFLSNILNAGKPAYANLILQDGGELTDNVLADLDPELWEDFQIHFIDSCK